MITPVYTIMAGSTGTVTPGAANQAYQWADGLRDAGDGGAGEFSSVLSRAMHGAIDASQAADKSSIAAIEGHGSVTDVVTAVSKAELALQTTVTIRDRMVAAYQEIMRMPI